MQAQMGINEQRVPEPPAMLKPAPLIERMRKARTGNHASFLAEASRRLAASVEMAVTMRSMADLSVPRLGDACMVVLLADAGAIGDVAIKHAAPESQAALAELADPPDDDPPAWAPVLSVARARRPMVLSLSATDAMLRGLGGSPTLVRELGFKSAALLPAIQRETELPLGVVVLLSERAQFFGAPMLRLARETTERFALALEVGVLYSQCRSTLMERQETLATTVHDLMSPLTVIKGTAQRLRRVERSVTDPDAVVEFKSRLETIDAAASRMAAALTVLLQSARLDVQDGLAGGFETADLNGVARRVVAEQQELTPDHIICLTEATQAAHGHWNVNQMERMLTNLISNAVKYSPPGSVIHVCVADEADDGGGWASVQIKDEGVGIPAADLPFVFEPFRRGSNVGQADGMGLGLASVWQTIKAHDGRLLIDSREGEGTCVTVRLPLDPRVPRATSTTR